MGWQQQAGRNGSREEQQQQQSVARVRRRHGGVRPAGRQGLPCTSINVPANLVLGPLDALQVNALLNHLPQWGHLTQLQGDREVGGKAAASERGPSACRPQHAAQ